MTLKQALDYGRVTLEEAKILEANLDAWYLLEFVTRIGRAEYFGNPKRQLNEEEWNVYQEIIQKRKQRIPLQHITGIQEFMGFLFKVNEHVLIPRQDTETLVELTLDYIPKTQNHQNSEAIEVLDMCTGSGCIIISILKMRNNVVGTGVDISKDALNVSRENGQLNDVNCNWIESDLFEKIHHMYDIIVSNPPYIPTSDIRELEEEVKTFDPMLALDGMDDGLFFYRKIIEEAHHYLKKGGILLFEIGYDQGEAVSSYMKEHNFIDVEIKKDLTGLDRVVYGHIE